eukprot:c20533_g1_i1.p1 GENE.c20533_g1_i1~~c20533_g1_i1.p1  ORF type:complete len:794 (+),score=316.63 c20533_g1_i1:41-2422(+)
MNQSLLILGVLFCFFFTTTNGKDLSQVENVLQVEKSTYSQLYRDCQGKEGECSCCCAGLNPTNSSEFRDCHPSSVWMIQGKCPPGLPISIPSTSCSYGGEFGWPQIDDPKCSMDVSVDDLREICQVSGCEEGIPQTCQCLAKYVDACFAVNYTLNSPEPCALTRNTAKRYLLEKNCASIAQGCPKPIYHSSSPVMDNCPESSEIGDHCSLQCAAGFIPSPAFGSSAELTCTDMGFLVTSGTIKCVAAIKCPLNTIPALSQNTEFNKVVIHDCEENSPVGSECVLSCAPGYTSTTSDYVTATCVASDGQTARYNDTISCRSATCSSKILPLKAVHSCPETASVGEKCFLTCPQGFSGTAVTAVCTGYGGKTNFPATARYQFDDLFCTETIPEPTLTITSLGVVSLVGSLRIPLQITPKFNSNIKDYIIRVPNRYTKIEISVETKGQMFVNLTCTDCLVEGNIITLVVGKNVLEISSPIVHSSTTAIYIIREDPPATGSDYDLPLEVFGSVLLETEFTEDWKRKHSASVQEALSALLRTERENIVITSILPGSVVIDFKVNASGLIESGQMLERFDNMMSNGDFKGLLCSSYQLCVESVSVLLPLTERRHAVALIPESSNEPLPQLPSISPAPVIPPKTRSVILTNPTQEDLTLVDCDTLEAQGCVEMYVENGCNEIVQINNCGHYGECQAKEKLRYNSLCDLNINCQSRAALSCVQKFVDGNCQDLVHDIACANYATCQANVAKECKVPIYFQLTPLQYFWLRMMLIYSFFPMLPLVAAANQGFSNGKPNKISN